METVNETNPPNTPPPPSGPPQKRLTRSTDDKVVAGLAGGLGRYFGTDPIVFRIAFVVLTLAGASGLLLYLVGWLLIPDDAGRTAVRRFGSERNGKLVAAVLAGLGVVLLFDNVTNDHGNVPVGLVLLAAGALLLWSRRNQTGGGGSSVPPAPPARPAPPAPPASPLPPTSPTASPTAPALVMPPAPTMPPAATIDDTQPLLGPPPPDTNDVATRPRSAVVPVTLSLLAILAGGLTMAGVSATTGLALALLVTGGGLMVGAWHGRARWLIPVGLVLALALTALSIVDVPIRGGTSDVRYTPVAVDEIRSPYRLAAGQMNLDLGKLDLRGETVTIVASVAAGDLRVTVPADAAVELDAHVGGGNLDLFGRQSDGLDVGRTVIESGREGGGRLVLRTRAGFGEVVVQRAVA